MKKTAEIIEEVELWLKSLVATGAETKSIAALTKALKESDHTAFVIAFGEYLRAATIYRTIWIPHIVGFMKAIAPNGAKKQIADPLFDVTNGLGWIHESIQKSPAKFDKRMEKWSEHLPQRLAAIHVANLNFVSKGLTDLPADLSSFVAKMRSKGVPMSLPASVESLVTAIKAGECTIAELATPSHNVMAWPLKAEDFSKELIVKEAIKYLKVKFALKISERTLSNRANEFPNIRVGNKYDRDGLNVVASAGHFHHKNLKQER